MGNQFDQIKERLKTRLSSFGQKLGHTLKSNPKVAGFPKKAGDYVSGKFRQWQVLEKIRSWLPQDLARTFPQTLDPVALAEWTGQAFQKQGARFYGTGLTILVSSYFMADLTALLAERFIPEPPVIHSFRPMARARAAHTIDDYGVIFTRNLFNSKGVIPGDETTNIPGQDSGGIPIKSTLPLNLIGTIILKDELASIATIEDKAANIVFPMRVQEEIPGKLKILSIEATKVVFVNSVTGRREFIDLPEDAALANLQINRNASAKLDAIQQVSGNQFSIARTEVDKAFSNISQILTQARAVPYFENGMPAGYRLVQIVPGSIYDKLGLKDNDTICGVNGSSINDPTDALRMMNDFRNSSHIELCVKRDGKQSTYSYEIH